MRLNLRFLAMIKFHSTPVDVLAATAGVEPSELSDLLKFGKQVDRDDPVILRVGKLLGFRRDDIFIEDDPPQEEVQDG